MALANCPTDARTPLPGAGERNGDNGVTSSAAAVMAYSGESTQSRDDLPRALPHLTVKLTRAEGDTSVESGQLSSESEEEGEVKEVECGITGQPRCGGDAATAVQEACSPSCDSARSSQGASVPPRPQSCDGAAVTRECEADDRSARSVSVGTSATGGNDAAGGQPATCDGSPCQSAVAYSPTAPRRRRELAGLCLESVLLTSPRTQRLAARQASLFTSRKRTEPEADLARADGGFDQPESTLQARETCSGTELDSGRSDRTTVQLCAAPSIVQLKPDDAARADHSGPPAADQALASAADPSDEPVTKKPRCASSKELLAASVEPIVSGTAAAVVPMPPPHPPAALPLQPSVETKPELQPERTTQAKGVRTRRRARADCSDLLPRWLRDGSARREALPRPAVTAVGPRISLKLARTGTSVEQHLSPPTALPVACRRLVGRDARGAARMAVQPPASAVNLLTLLERQHHMEAGSSGACVLATSPNEPSSLFARACTHLMRDYPCRSSVARGGKVQERVLSAMAGGAAELGAAVAEGELQAVTAMRQQLAAEVLTSCNTWLA